MHWLILIQLSKSSDGCHERRFCLMRKEEMLKDGQDEPVTSMPMKRDEMDNTKKNLLDTDDQYTAEDPIMNAPSC